MKRPTSVPPPGKTTTYTLIMFQHAPEENPVARINRRVVSIVQRALDRKISTPKEATEIDVWLESPGGDAHAAYKLALELRSRARTLKAVIPDYAKSAATLLSLGMDVIYMAAAAELGPLDVQIEHPDREGMIISALDVVGALDFLGRTAMTLTLTGGASAVQYTKLSRSEVLRDMLTFSADLVRPAVSKLDPHLLHRASKELRVAEKYAIDLLGKIHPTRRRKVQDPEELVQLLVEDYPAHGFAISRDEITRLGLIAEPAESHPRWPLIKMLHRKAQEEGEPVILVATDTELDNMASKMQDQGGEDDEDDGSEKDGDDSGDDAPADQGDRDSVVRERHGAASP